MVRPCPGKGQSWPHLGLWDPGPPSPTTQPPHWREAREGGTEGDCVCAQTPGGSLDAPVSIWGELGGSTRLKVLIAPAMFAQHRNIYTEVGEVRASQVALAVKNLPATAGDVRDSISAPGSGAAPGGGHGNSLHCLSCRITHPEETGRLQPVGWHGVEHG